MREVKKINDVFVFFLVLFSLNFFSATFAQSGLFKIISFAYLFGTILLSLPYFFTKNSGFIFPIKLICISVIISAFMAYISWGQSLSYISSTTPYLIWFVFFYLLHIKYPINKIERIILFYGFLYIVLYFFQFLHNDVVYFGFREEFIEDRGIIRIDFPGGGVFYLAYFIALNKCSKETRFRWLFILFVILSLVVTVLQVTRQSIAIVLILSLFHFIRTASISKRIAVLSLFSTLLFYFFNSDNPVSKGLAEEQKETVSEGAKYIRVLAADYYIKDFSPNTLSRIFGNGFPNLNSDYGKFISNVQETYGFYAADLGLIGIYALFGIFTVAGLIIIFFKGFFAKLPKQYYYLKYYISFLLFTCLTSDYSFSVNYLITTVFVAYCYQRLYEEKSKKLSYLNSNEIYHRNSSI